MIYCTSHSSVIPLAIAGDHEKFLLHTYMPQTCYIFWLYLQLQSLWVTILLHSSNLSVAINAFFPIIRQYLKYSQNVSTGGNVPWKEKFSSSLIIRKATRKQNANHTQQISLHNFLGITLYCTAAFNKLLPKFKRQRPNEKTQLWPHMWNKKNDWHGKSAYLYKLL